MKATAELKMLPVSVLKPAAYNPRKKLKPGDKEYEKMVDIMAPFASFIITVTPDNPRALDKEILADCYRSYGKSVDTAEDVFTAQRQAETLAQEMTEPVIVVFGSLSFIGPLIPRIK